MNEFFKKFIKLAKSYDSLMEKILFSMIGRDDLSKTKLERSDFARSWLLNKYKKVVSIHHREIRNYIFWIVIAVTVILVILAIYMLLILL